MADSETLNELCEEFVDFEEAWLSQVDSVNRALAQMLYMLKSISHQTSAACQVLATLSLATDAKTRDGFGEEWNKAMEEWAKAKDTAAAHVRHMKGEDDEAED